MFSSPASAFFPADAVACAIQDRVAGRGPRPARPMRHRRALNMALVLALAAPYFLGAQAPATRDHLIAEYSKRRLRRLIEDGWRAQATTPENFGCHWESTVRVTRFLEAYLGQVTIPFPDLRDLRLDYESQPIEASRLLDLWIAEAAGSWIHMLGEDRPSSPGNFSEHWDSAKGLIVTLQPDERRSAGVSYGRLVRVRITARRDPVAAAKDLDQLIQELKSFLAEAGVRDQGGC